MPDAACPIPPADRCPYCGHPRALVYVHGHGQCAHCGCNIEPCCQPDSWPDDAEPPAARH